MTMRINNNTTQYYKWWWWLLCESSLVTYSLLRSNVNVSTFALFTFGIALREFFRKGSDSLFVFWVPLNILSSSQYSLSIPIFLSCTARVQKCHAHRFVSYNSVPPRPLLSNSKYPRSPPSRQISETNISIIAVKPEQEPIPRQSQRFIIRRNYLSQFSWRLNGIFLCAFQISDGYLLSIRRNLFMPLKFSTTTSSLAKTWSAPR